MSLVMSTSQSMRSVEPPSDTAPASVRVRWITTPHRGPSALRLVRIAPARVVTWRDRLRGLPLGRLLQVAWFAVAQLAAALTGAGVDRLLQALFSGGLL
jgi:hypothetical protein